MFKELFLESEEVAWFTAPENVMDKISNKLDKWNMENDFPFQNYYTHKVGNKREFVIEDMKKFKKYEKELTKIIKPFVPNLKKL
jgi:hypothetical protein